MLGPRVCALPVVTLPLPVRRLLIVAGGAIGLWLLYLLLQAPAARADAVPSPAGSAAAAHRPSHEPAHEPAPQSAHRSVPAAEHTANHTANHTAEHTAEHTVRRPGPGISATALRPARSFVHDTVARVVTDSRLASAPDTARAIAHRAVNIVSDTSRTVARTTTAVTRTATDGVTQIARAVRHATSDLEQKATPVGAEVVAPGPVTMTPAGAGAVGHSRPAAVPARHVSSALIPRRGTTVPSTHHVPPAAATYATPTAARTASVLPLGVAEHRAAWVHVATSRGGQPDRPASPAPVAPSTPGAPASTTSGGSAGTGLPGCTHTSGAGFAPASSVRWTDVDVVPASVVDRRPSFSPD